MTKPNDFDEFRRGQEERRRRTVARVLNVLTLLAILAIGTLVLRIIFR